MSAPRFVVDRGHHGSVTLRDTVLGRMAATFHRDWDRHGYRSEKADQVTCDMAGICADALNARHEAYMLAKAQDGGK